MRRAALLAAVVLIVAGLVAPAAASSPPTPICRFCGDNFEAAAMAIGVNASVSASHVLVEVHEDGHASWTVRLHLTGGADAFAASPDRLRGAGRVLTGDGYGLPREASFVDAEVEGDVAVLRFRVTDGVDRHAGLLVVDILHNRGNEPRYVVNADTFTVRGPSGAVVANDPNSGHVDGDAVTWRGDSTDSAAAPSLEGSPYVVFGPDRSAFTRLRASAAMASATIPILSRSLRRFLLFQTAIFTLLLVLVVTAFSWWMPHPRRGPLLAAIGSLGVIGIALSVAMYGPAWITGPPLLGLGLVAVAFTPAVRDRLGRPREQALAVAGVLFVAYLLLLGVHIALASEWADPPVIALRATALAFPLAAMVPLGAAMAVEPDRLRRWVALTVLAFVAVPATLVNLGDPPTGFGGGIYTLALFAIAVAAPLLGAFGLALGQSLAVGDASADQRSRTLTR